MESGYAYIENPERVLVSPLLIIIKQAWEAQNETHSQTNHALPNAWLA